MSLPKVSFTLGQGGLGRPLQGFDHYSAMIAYYYASSVNTNYANIGDKIYNSIEDAEDDGVVDTCAEATAATSSQVVTATGADGDTITFEWTNPDGTVITLGSYTKITADSTVTLVKTALVAAINANTYTTGFSATAGAVGAWTITAPQNQGIYPNTLSVTETIVGTIANTNNAFSGGTRSNLAMFHYQISEFFRINPLGVLYFSIKFDDSAQSASAFNTQVQTDGLAVANAFEGNARQFLVYNPFRTFATSTLNALKSLRTTLFNQYTPAIFGYVGGFTGSLSSQTNLRALTDEGVSAIIGQSGSGVGYEQKQTQYTVVCQGGTWLGSQSVAKVSQSIGEVQAFNLSDGTECETAYFFDGTDFTTISTSLADQLHDYGYTFLRKFKGGFTGTYWNSGNCAVSPSSDYAYTEDVRTIDKVVRGVYQSILPLLNSKNKVNADGTLSTASIIGYEEKCNVVLDAMRRDEDLSDAKAIVSTTAVVATTGIVPINIKLQQTPISREISVTVGYSIKI